MNDDADNKKKKEISILFVYNHDRSWVNDDIDILKKNFDLTTYFYKKDKGINDIKKLVKENDVIYIWFASYHGLKSVKLAKKYDKKVITVAGGYDTANVKGYGLPTRLYTKWIPKYILGRSDCILTFSHSSKRDIEKVVKGKDIMVSYGIDTKKFYPKGKKQRSILTVANLDQVSWNRKGIPMMMEIAKRKTDIYFTVAGRYDISLKKEIDNSPDNMLFTGYVSEKKLLEQYQKAKIYIQLSSHEGLCSALGEAMLCGCIPVVTDCGSLPEVVGNTGIIVRYGNIDDYVRGIEQAMDMENNEKPREKIEKNYSLKQREKTLVSLIKDIQNKRV